MYDDGIEELEFPVSICPDREAGRVHGPHRIEGTWREHCSGVEASEDAERGEKPAR
jgi:hypothetical protein